MILIILVCSLFTGCTLLDVKDKGGMINPDAASLEGETSTDGDRTENDISRFMKNKTGSEPGSEISGDSDRSARDTSGAEMQKTISGGAWMTAAGKSALAEDRESAERGSRCVFCRLYSRFYGYGKTGAD